MAGGVVRAVFVLLALTLTLSGCGGGDQDCCKYCSKGKACGDTCISRRYVCHVGKGCACNKLQMDSLIARGGVAYAPVVAVGRIEGVSGIEYSSGGEYGVVGPEGEYTFEIGEPVTFRIGEIYVTRNPALVSSVYDLDEEVEGVRVLDVLAEMDEDGDPSNGYTVPVEESPPM